MKRIAACALLVALVTFGAAVPTPAQQGVVVEPVRFATLDVFIDSREPLAAWQFELAERGGSMTVVGVENGDSDAFESAPHYDLDAVQRGAAERIVVADYSLSPAARLPVGDTRVATIHVRLAGGARADYALRLVAAGNAAGEPIDAAIRLNTEPGRAQR